MGFAHSHPLQCVLSVRNRVLPVRRLRRFHPDAGRYASIGLHHHSSPVLLVPPSQRIVPPSPHERPSSWCHKPTLCRSLVGGRRQHHHCHHHRGNYRSRHLHCRHQGHHLHHHHGLHRDPSLGS